MADSLTAHDQREAYCRRLGHHLAFSYCRSPGSDEPCGSILDCWFERFDVAGYMARHYPHRSPGRAGVTPKLVSLLELIQQAQGEADRP